MNDNKGLKLLILICDNMTRRGIKRVIDRTQEMSEKGPMAVQPAIRRLELLKEAFMTGKPPEHLSASSYFTEWECKIINETTASGGPTGNWKHRLLEQTELLRLSLDERIKKMDMFSDYGYVFIPKIGSTLPGLLTNSIKEGDRALVRLNKQPLMPVLIRSVLIKQFGAVTEADLIGTIEHEIAKARQTYGKDLFGFAVKKSLGQYLSDDDPITIVKWERERWEWADVCKKEQERLDAI